MQRITRREALAGAAAMIGVASRADAQSSLGIRFVMPTSPADYLLPYFVAHDQGWLGKEGLDVTEKVVLGDVGAVRALLSGSCEQAFPGVGPILSAVAEGGTIKIVGSWQPVVDYFIVVRAGLSTKIADLAGKKWATYGPGGLSTAIPTLLMKKYNLDVSKASFLSVGDQPSRLQAVVGGKVDATILDSYVTTRAEREGQIAAVVPVVKEFPGMGNVFLVLRTEALSDPRQRRAAAIMVKGGIAGARFIMKDPDKAAEIMQRRLPDADLGLLKETMARVNKLGIWGVDGGLERSVIDYTTETYFSMGQLSRRPSYEELVDHTLVDEALHELGRFS